VKFFVSSVRGAIISDDERASSQNCRGECSVRFSMRIHVRYLFLAVLMASVVKGHTQDAIRNGEPFTLHVSNVRSVISS
jgi:hypothetical protein